MLFRALQRDQRERLRPIHFEVQRDLVRRGRVREAGSDSGQDRGSGRPDQGECSRAEETAGGKLMCCRSNKFYFI